MSEFTLSQPFAAILQAASIDPVSLNDVIDRQLAKRREAVLRPSHPYLVKVRKRTGVPLMMVVRRRRHLLIEVESRTPFWRYKEHGRLKCQLLIGKQVPETIASAAAGGRLGDFFGGVPVLDDLLIRSITSLEDLADLEVEPHWRKSR